MDHAQPSIDVERIRVPAERDARAALAWEQRLGQMTHPSPEPQARRRALLATSLLLTDTMAPEAYAAARDAMAALGVSDTIELFQSSRGGGDTARLALYGAPIGVEFIGGYLGSLDRGGMLAVIGHEIGHCVAHCRNPAFAWALSASQVANTAATRAYAMAAELTADRFGLLACRDLNAVLRLEMLGAAGRASHIRFDTEAYLKQCRVVGEELVAGGSRASGHTHPEHYVRGYAEWLFSETDLYATITGLGPGSRSIAEVDGTLRTLLGVRRRSEREVRLTCAPARPPSAVRAPNNKAPAVRRPADDTILTPAARRTLAATGAVLATAAQAVTSSLGRFADAARDRLRDSAGEQPAEQVDAPDLLDEERRDLIARFEELEKRSEEK